MRLASVTKARFLHNKTLSCPTLSIHPFQSHSASPIHLLSFRGGATAETEARVAVQEGTAAGASTDAQLVLKKASASMPAPTIPPIAEKLKIALMQPYTFESLMIATMVR